MKRLAFWIVVGIVAVNLYRGQSCARDGRDPGPVDVVARDPTTPGARPATHAIAIAIANGSRGSPSPSSPRLASPRPRSRPRALARSREVARGSVARGSGPNRPTPARSSGSSRPPSPAPSPTPASSSSARPPTGSGPTSPARGRPRRSWSTRWSSTRKSEPVVKDYGTLYEATLRADFSPERRDKIVRVYERELVARRLALLGGVLGFVLVCLGGPGRLHPGRRGHQGLLHQPAPPGRRGGGRRGGRGHLPDPDVIA